jgi:hypothetical protein
LEAIAGVASRLSPEVSRKLSYEYRSRTTVFGWPLFHMARGVDPATGRKRSARGIIALGSSARGVIAFGDTAVGVIACGIFGYGIISVSMVGVGVISISSVAVGLWWAVGGLALAPCAVGGLVIGYYACGQVVVGKYVMGPHLVNPIADAFFNPWIGKIVDRVFKFIPIVTILFLVIGCIPQLVAKASERRRKRRFHRDKLKSV